VSDAFGVTFEGPLAPFASRFEEALAAEGYSKRWAQELTGLGADLSRWLAQRGLAAADLTGDVVDEFFAECGSSRSRCRTARSLRPIVAQLRSLGLVAGERTVALGRTDAEDELLGCFRRWCLAQRGLAPATVDQYLERVAAFLALWRSDAGVAVADWTPVPSWRPFEQPPRPCPVPRFAAWSRRCARSCVSCTPRAGPLLRWWLPCRR